MEDVVTHFLNEWMRKKSEKMQTNYSKVAKIETNKRFAHIQLRNIVCSNLGLKDIYEQRMKHCLRCM